MFTIFSKKDVEQLISQVMPLHYRIIKNALQSITERAKLLSSFISWYNYFTLTLFTS